MSPQPKTFLTPVLGFKNLKEPFNYIIFCE